VPQGRPTSTCISNMKRLTFVLSVALLSGCASVQNSATEGYTGPTAQVDDSFNAVSGSKVEFFYVDKLDGHDLRNARSASLIANAGGGLRMTPVAAGRIVPASKPISLVIVARTEYAAPILVLTNAVYQVKGTVDITLEPNKHYVVKGALSEASSSVWLEDAESHQVAGKKIQIDGSAKLGFFEK
jgi:hypothetical protein